VTHFLLSYIGRLKHDHERSLPSATEGLQTRLYIRGVQRLTALVAQVCLPSPAHLGAVGNPIPALAAELNSMASSRQAGWDLIGSFLTLSTIFRRILKAIHALGGYLNLLAVRKAWAVEL